jgi:SAM-dependent methyltransferase
MHDPAAMVRLDITEIDFPDESFDVVYCSHVLEHVPDDRKALAEIRRVLKPDGWAILLVPIDAAETIEDPSITDPGERLRLFGQGDHVRRYGPDYVERLHQAGFDVAVTSPPQLATPVEIASMGLTPASGEIFHCSCQPRHA